MQVLQAEYAVEQVAAAQARMAALGARAPRAGEPAHEVEVDVQGRRAAPADRQRARAGRSRRQLLVEERQQAVQVQAGQVALAVDALKDFSRKEIKGKTIVCVVSGGNFDFERLPDVKERALRFEGLKKYFVIRFPQRPGALRDFLERLGPDDDIARFEYLKKSARNFGSVLIGIETKERRNFELLVARFDANGVQYQDITDNETLAGFII